MSNIMEPGFKSSENIAKLNDGFQKMNPEERKAQINKANVIFELRLKNAEGKEGIWTIDMKKDGTVHKGPAQPKADVTFIMSDETMASIAEGKLNAQKALMTGKLKVKGNMILATKIDGVLKSAKGKSAKL